MKIKKTLILTVAFGGGHLQAAKAKQKEILAKNPKEKVIEVDVLNDWVNKWLNVTYLAKWNEWQRVGNVCKQERLKKGLFLADIFFAPMIFYNTFKTLLAEDIDRIIDTQVVGTSSIILAIRLANRFTKKNLYLEKVITELPTDQVTHFFKPIKSLSRKSKKHLRIISTHPLLKEHQTTETFWKEQCGVPESIISYDSLPLRPSFIDLRKKQRVRKKMTLPIHYENAFEQKLILSAIKKGSSHYKVLKNELSMTIEPDDRVSLVMLGSRPNEKATLEYVEHFINILLKEKNQNKKDLLFVFCSSERNSRGFLLEKISNLVSQARNYPKSLTVIPMPFQDDSVIAPLFFRSDATFTRSGGLTSMELLTVCSGKIWIHAENLKKGSKIFMMPHWELGNAYYLKEKKGAEIVTPEKFESTCSWYFSK